MRVAKCERWTGWGLGYAIGFYWNAVCWLLIGYAASLGLIGRVASADLWEAGVCVVAAAPLLLIVLKALGSPKRFLCLLPRAATTALGLVTGIGQFVLPWLGWSALIWAMNRRWMGWDRAMAAGAGVAVWSYLTGLLIVLVFRPKAADVQVTRWEVLVRGLPEAFDGYEIMHVSDLHVSRLTPLSEVEARLGAAREIQTDLIAFTGDLVDKGVRLVEGAAAALAGLRARDGAVAVLGNHDIWAGDKVVGEALRRNGVGVLVNGHMVVERNGSKLYLAGVDDASYTDRDDLAAAFDGIPDGATVALLSHTPDIVRNRLALRASLVLSGHTHGGQVVLPWIGPVYAPTHLGRRWAWGLHPFGDSWLFVTRGLGEVFPPLRIACPPEVALITLRRKPTGPP